MNSIDSVCVSARLWQERELRERDSRNLMPW